MSGRARSAPALGAVTDDQVQVLVALFVPMAQALAPLLAVALAPHLAELTARPEPVAASHERFTLLEAADVARCSQSTLRRAIATGRLKASKLGQGGSSRVLIARVELARFLREAEQ